MVVPPAFYEDDMVKWEKKFKTARESRQQQKMMIKSLGCFQPCGTKNTNVQQSGAKKHQRRNSRASANTFSGVDFEYTGNTNDV